MTATQTTTDADELRSRATISVTRAAEILGLSRAYCYSLIASGELPAVKLNGGKRVLVPTAGLRAMLGIED